MATILIVDDEAANRLLVVTLLQYAGHRVLEAQNGAEALAAAKEHRPDLVIVDLYLPGMHGTQFVKTLRADDDLKDMKVALYTGTQIDSMLEDFMRLHRIACLIPKPAEPEDLIRIVNDALQSELL